MAFYDLFFGGGLTDMSLVLTGIWQCAVRQRPGEPLGTRYLWQTGKGFSRICLGVADAAVDAGRFHARPPRSPTPNS
jgi:hypothetical protein